MTDSHDSQPRDIADTLPSVERVEAELATATCIDAFLGKDGIFARLFARTLEEMLQAELTAHLGYSPYEAEGRNSGNSRNGRYPRTVRSSLGETTIQMPRDRNGTFSPHIVPKHMVASSNELEDKIISLYGRGMSTRDIQEELRDLYGVEVSAATLSTVTDKVWGLVEAWQNRPLAALYPIVFLDAVHMKIRRDSKVENTAVYVVLGVDMEGHRDVLGHWIGNGGEGANFWLSVLADLQARGVEDILIACMDGLTGFLEAVHAIFPETLVQRGVIHQIRHTLKYVPWQERKAFMGDLRQVYGAATREAADAAWGRLKGTWGARYPIAIRSWENHWEELTAYFDFPTEIRRLIYTTNTVENYHRQLRKVTKTKGSFPTPDAVRKLLYLATQNITNKWTAPTRHWAKILNQLVIRFAPRVSL